MTRSQRHKRVIQGKDSTGSSRYPGENYVWDWVNTWPSGSDDPGIISVKAGGVDPAFYPLTEGDELSSIPDYVTLVDPLNYESTEGTIATAVVQVDGVTQPGTYVVSQGEVVTLLVTDDQGNPRTWFIDFDVADLLIAPVVTASDSLLGRNLTITVDSVSGEPAPSVSLRSLTLNGSNVLGQQTGTGPWVYATPSSSGASTVTWEVAAINGVNPTGLSGGSEIVAADLFAPTLTASDSLSGRDVIITVDSITGTPAATATLTALTLDGASVLGQQTGTGPWTYSVASSTSAQTVAWTVTASNGISPSATASDTEVVPLDLIPPAITASDSLLGRDLTITVDSLTGAPAPSATLTTLTLDGVDVLGQQTGTGPWVYAVPTSGVPQTVAWTVTAANGVSPNATASGSEVVAADTAAPTVTASDSLAGRDLTITVTGTSGDPAPSTSLTSLTLDGGDVLGNETGTGPWVYAVPSSGASQTVSWEVTATNGVPPDDTATGSEVVAADLTVPAQMGAPTLSVISATELEATYAAAPDDGGSAITGYDLRYSDDEATWTTAVSAISPVSITGLTASTLYYVQTRAKNGLGAGAWSVSATATTSSGAVDDYELASGKTPQLVADFENTYYRKNGVDDTVALVSHTGPVLATMTDSTGTIVYAPHNRIRDSEDSSRWQAGSQIITTGQSDPLGGTDAVLVTGTGTGFTWIMPATDGVENGTIAIYAKAGTATTFQYAQFLGVIGVTYDLSAETATIVNSDHISAATITSVGGGWYKCTATDTGSETPFASGNRWIIGVNGPTTTDSIYWAFPHLQAGPIGVADNPAMPAGFETYVPSTPQSVDLPRDGNHTWNGTSWVNAGRLHEPTGVTNNHLYSNDLAGTGTWHQKIPAGITTVQGADGPLGTGTAWTLTAPNTGGTGFVRLSSNITLSVSTTFTYSVYLKAGTYSWVYLQAQSFTVPGSFGAWFNISTGAVGTVESGITAHTPQDVGNGWYRCAITFTLGGTDDTGAVNIFLAPSDNSLSTALDGTSSILASGVQCEAGSFPTSYIPTTGSTVTRAADTMTIAAADITANTTAFAFQISGTMTYADTGSFAQFYFLDWETGGAGADFQVYQQTNGAYTGSVVSRNYDGSVLTELTGGLPGSFSEGTDISFNIASRDTTSEIQTAVNGSILNTSTTPITIPDLDAIDLWIGGRSGDGFSEAVTFNIKRIQFFGEDLTTADMQEVTT